MPAKSYATLGPLFWATCLLWIGHDSGKCLAPGTDGAEWRKDPEVAGGGLTDDTAMATLVAGSVSWAGILARITRKCVGHVTGGRITLSALGKHPRRRSAAADAAADVFFSAVDGAW